MAPDLISRVIPQIYRPEEYFQIRSLGFHDIIWTLYRYPAPDEKILKLAEIMDLYAITMPLDRLETGLARELRGDRGHRSRHGRRHRGRQDRKSVV